MLMVCVYGRPLFSLPPLSTFLLMRLCFISCQSPHAAHVLAQCFGPGPHFRHHPFFFVAIPFPPPQHSSFTISHDPSIHGAWLHRKFFVHII